MKRAILGLCLVVMGLMEAKGQWVTIPDANFAAFLRQQYPTCMNGSLMDTTCNAIVNDTDLDCSYSILIQTINSLDGIQYFDNLINLDCNGISLRTIPSFPSNLNHLGCRSNGITSVPAFPSTLKSIDLGYNGLTSLPELPDYLEFLDIGNNPFLLCLPILKKIDLLIWDGTGINCMPNYGTNVFGIPDITSYPLCSPSNANGCKISYNIGGRGYSDKNNNCTKDVNEINQPNWKIKLLKSGALVRQTFTMNSGNYLFDNLPYGSYSVLVETTGTPFKPNCDSIRPVTISVNDPVKYGIDFPLGCKPGFDLGAVTLYKDSGKFFPNQTSSIVLTAGDMSLFWNQPCSNGIRGEVSLVFFGPIQFAGVKSGSKTPDRLVNDSIIWKINDFAVIDIFHDFQPQFLTDSLAQIGQQICFEAFISLESGDTDPSNNYLKNCFAISNSFDPNNKEVNPLGDLDVSQSYLTYTVNFQNTGNDTAIHIQIIDTLDGDIDMASFKLLAYSHPNITQILEGGIVKFNFPNIMLPDSHVNEPLSHGYIQYKVKLKDNLPIGTQINNTAYIYFDFNAPVVTNTATNTISTAVGISPLSFGDGLGVRLFPNPASDKVQIIIEGKQDKVQMNLYNSMGGLIHSLMINSQHELNLSHLSSGVYHIRFTTPEGLFTSKYLVVGR